MSSRNILSTIWNAMVGELTSAERSETALDEEWAKEKSTRETDCQRNEPDPEQYTYTALTLLGSNTGSIRLLHLLPGSRQDDIHCRLVQANLNTCANTYEALSYVWGQRELTPIQVDSATLLVGTNLRSALLNLRRTDEIRTLWVDAICINQQDMDEKAGQVSIMGTIYRNASQVVVWLGEANKYTREAFKTLTMLDNGRRGLLGDSEPGALRSRLHSLFKHDTITHHVFAEPWWFRAWTAQEILLARDALVVWGPYQIGWDVLVGGIEFGVDLDIWESAGLGVWNDSDMLPLEAVLKLKREPRLPNVGDNILRHLAHTRFRHATNDRDKIFSVLGLSEDNSTSFVQPNYRAPSTDIYREFAVRLISVAGNYDILGFCQDAGDGKHVGQMPSWVPDWSSTGYIAMPLLTDSMGKPRATHASRKFTASPQFRSGGTVMVARGQVLDRVYALAEVLAYLDENDWHDGSIIEDTPEQSLKEMIQDIGADLKMMASQFYKVVPYMETYVAWEAFVRDMYRGGDKATAEDAAEVYMQTICTGTMAPGGHKETRRLFQSWLDLFSSIRRLKSWKLDKWQSVYNPLGFGGYIKSSWNNSSGFTKYLKAAYERRLGATKSGRICLLPKATKIGDCLVVLEGGRVPVVLRSGDDGVYSFVGEAYVHDLMDGSAFDEAKCEELPIR